MSNKHEASRVAQPMEWRAHGNLLAKRFNVRAAMLSMALAFALPAVQAQVSVPGSFAVKPDGSASYSIPVQVPPGIAGMEPRLAFVYNSHGGNGQLGMGWSLGGLSTISRCPQTQYQDNARVGVSFAATDRFCMDGQRLMLTAGTYGQTSATYATEIETFSRVKQAATSAGLPYFTVQARDGKTYEYGNSTDSRVMAPGSTTLVRLWLLDKVIDAFGNYMSITYTSDTTKGNAYPSTISYTANDSASPPLAATSSVVFSYDLTRTDMASGYQGGYLVGNRALLTGVTTYNGSTKVLNYTLGYESGYDTGRKRLKTVKLCDGAGTTCLPATTMKFPTTSSATATSTEPGVVSESAGKLGNTNGQDPSLLYSLWPGQSWFAFDYENTGRVGFVHFSGSTGPVSLKQWHSNGDGTFAIHEGLVLPGQFGTQIPSTLYPADINGDGAADIVAKITGIFDSTCPNGGLNYRKGVYLNNGSGVYSALSTFAKACVDGIDFPMDVNGDGMTDLVHLGVVSPRTIDVALAVGDGTFAPQTQASTTVDVSTAGSWQQLDVNGDGIQDLVHFVDNSGNYFVWKANGANGYTVTKATASTIDKSLTTGTWLQLDLNGDGLSDLVHITTASGASQGTAYVWMNKGDGTFAVTALSTTVDKVVPKVQTIDENEEPSTADAFVIADYNGDGRADIVHLADTAGTFYVWESNGDGTFTIVSHKRNDDLALTTGYWKGADITGTGVTDLVHFTNDTGDFKVWSLPRVDRDVPLSIDNGAGTVYGFNEKTLPQILGIDGSQGGSYTRAAVSPYPATQTTVVPSLHVVTDSSESDGLGGSYHTGYNYGSARVERTGRGFLGFEWFESIDTLTSLTTRTTFSQTFPYVGQVATQTRGVSHAAYNSLSTTTNTFDCMDPAAGSAGQACAVAPNRRYFPFATRTDVARTDLDGVSKLPLSRTTIARSDIDLYGNVTKVTQTTLNADGTSNAAEDYSSVTTRTFNNDTTNWRLGRVLTSTVTASGPTVPAVVKPGVGSNLPPPAPAPKTPPQVFLPIILELLLGD